MRVQLNAPFVVVFVALVAVFGLLLGAAFGYGAGRVAPEFFVHLWVGEEIEPLGTATMMGAFGGVVCGGCLGVFAVAVQALAERVRGGR